MSGGGWGYLVAIGLGFALASSAWAEPPDGQPRSDATTQNTQQKPPAGTQPGFLPTVQDALQRIARSLETANAKEETPEERDTAKRDLDAQETMAWWSRAVAYVAGFEAFITAIGVALVGFTLKYTRDAAEAARDAVDEAIKATAAANKQATNAEVASERELRAYLSVEPVGVYVLIGTDEAIGQVRVNNVGRVPAQNVHVVVHMLLGSSKNTQIGNRDADIDGVERAIQPGASFRQGSREQYPVNDIRQGVWVFVWGVAYYDDGYGNRRWTRFCHRYNSGSRTRYEMGMTETGQPALLDADKARYYTTGNDAV
jgi:hypothetical protein